MLRYIMLGLSFEANFISPEFAVGACVLRLAKQAGTSRSKAQNPWKSPGNLFVFRPQKLRMSQAELVLFFEEIYQVGKVVAIGMANGVVVKASL